MIKFIHAADIHLDSPLHMVSAYEGAPMEALQNAARRSFENLIEMAIQEPVDFVLLAGDLYDGDWKDYNTGLYLVSQLRKLREAGIPVLMVAGNHDAVSRITKTLRLPEGVTLFPSGKAATVLLEDCGVAVHGRSFSTSVMTQNLARGYPEAVDGCYNVGLLHTALNGREGHASYAPCSLDDLRQKAYQYWALGHAHGYETVLKDPLVIFSGNTQGRHIRECGPKGCVMVHVNDRGDSQIDFRHLDVVRWDRIEIDASDIDNPYGVVDRAMEMMEGAVFQSAGRPLITRIEIRGASPVHAALAGDVEHWTGEIRSAAIDAFQEEACIEKVKIMTSDPITSRVRDQREGPVGELIECLKDLESDPEALLSLGQSLEDLHNRMPRELREGDDALNPHDPEWMAEMVRQVRPMLLRRLLKKGVGA